MAENNEMEVMEVELKKKMKELSLLNNQVRKLETEAGYKFENFNRFQVIAILAS